MYGRSSTRLALSAAFAAAILGVQAASAGGAGHGGPMVHVASGVHGGVGGPHRPGGYELRSPARNLPPVAGVIHERPGMRTYFSAYGHTDTASMPGHYGGGRWAGDGHVVTRSPTGYGRAGFDSPGGSEHIRTAASSSAERRWRFGERGDEGFQRARTLRDRFGFSADHRRFGYGVAGVYGDVGGYEGYGDAGTYGGPGFSGAGGIAGSGGVYGGAETWDGGSAAEAPLTARFAEVPLGPSPGMEGGPNDRYAEAASEDAGPSPRVITIDRAARPGCGCGPRVAVAPTVYRYGVGTAY